MSGWWLLLGAVAYLLVGVGLARLYLWFQEWQYDGRHPAGRDYLRGNMWAILSLWPVVIPIWALGLGVRWLLLPERMR